MWPRPRADITEEMRIRLEYAEYSREEIEGMTSEEAERVLGDWPAKATHSSTQPLPSMTSSRLAGERPEFDEVTDLF